MDNVVVADDSLPATNMAHAAKMTKLEEAIQAELEPRNLAEYHYFAHGTYTRELHIPAGTVLTGKIHRHSCINILSKGEIAVVTDEGEYRLKAPHTFVSGPGVKKAGYAVTDSIWINVHPWDGEPDLEAVEHEVIIPSYAALALERQARLEDRT